MTLGAILDLKTAYESVPKIRIYEIAHIKLNEKPQLMVSLTLQSTNIMSKAHQLETIASVST